MTAIFLPDDDRQDPNQRQTNLLPFVTDEHTPPYLSNFLAPLSPVYYCQRLIASRHSRPSPTVFLVTHFQNTPVRHLTMAYDSRRPLLSPVGHAAGIVLRSSND